MLHSMRIRISIEKKDFPHFPTWAFLSCLFLRMLYKKTNDV